MYSPTPVHKLLANASGQLSQLARHGAQLQQFNHLIHHHLPSPLNQHCQVANLKEGHLVLATDAPVWSSLLRYHTSGILELFKHQAGLPQLRGIRIRTLPHQGHPTAKKLRRPIISKDTASLLCDLAEAMEDPALKNAVLRLARHASTDRQD